MKSFRSLVWFCVCTKMFGISSLAWAVPTPSDAPVQSSSGFMPSLSPALSISTGLRYDVVHGAVFVIPLDAKLSTIGRWTLGARITYAFGLASEYFDLSTAATVATELYRGDRLRLFAEGQIGLNTVAERPRLGWYLDFGPQLGATYSLTSWFAVGLTGTLNFRTALGSIGPNQPRVFPQIVLGVPLIFSF